MPGLQLLDRLRRRPEPGALEYTRPAYAPRQATEDWPASTAGELELPFAPNVSSLIGQPEWGREVWRINSFNYNLVLLKAAIGEVPPEIPGLTLQLRRNSAPIWSSGPFDMPMFALTGANRYRGVVADGADLINPLQVQATDSLEFVIVGQGPGIGYGPFGFALEPMEFALTVIRERG